MKIRRLPNFLQNMKMLPFIINGITLMPFGIFIRKGQENNKRLINHESIHAQQQKELLFIFFYILYGIDFILKFLKYGNLVDTHREIMFEREAYTNQYDFSYLNKRKYWSFIKYMFKNNKKN